MEHQLDALRDAFAKCGWLPEQNPAIASKEFDTACTPKRAYLYQFLSGTLTGSYESEGRNALSTLLCRVDEDQPDTLLDQARQIDTMVSDAVDKTYARSLWLLGVRARPLIADPASMS
jgi:hypothetical protein